MPWIARIFSYILEISRIYVFRDSYTLKICNAPIVKCIRKSVDKNTSKNTSGTDNRDVK